MAISDPAEDKADDMLNKADKRKALIRKAKQEDTAARVTRYDFVNSPENYARRRKKAFEARKLAREL